MAPLLLTGLLIAATPTTAPWFKPRVTVVDAPDDLFHTPGTLFINFDGADMQSCNGSDWPVNNCSSIMNDTVLPYSGGESSRAAVVQQMAADVAPFAVTVVGERPIDDDEYDMVMVGNWEPPPEDGGFAGVAPTIDCYNATRGETSFSLDAGSASVVAKIVGQEAAHVWGLEHVDSASDLLFPTIGGAADPSFENTCHQIVILDGGISPTEAVCAEMHSINCPDQADHQNSYQDMMMVFGPASPDMAAPSLEIIAPMDGEMFPSGADIEVRFTMSDNVAPPLFEVFASIDVDEKGEAVGSADYLGPELSLPVNGLPDGEHLIRIDIADQSGNESFDVVQFVIGEETPDGTGESGDGSGSGGGDDPETGTPAGESSGGGDDGDTDSEDPSSDTTAEGCGCRADPGPFAAWLVLLILGVSPRRRRL